MILHRFLDREFALECCLFELAFGSGGGGSQGLSREQVKKAKLKTDIGRVLRLKLSKSAAFKKVLDKVAKKKEPQAKAEEAKAEEAKAEEAKAEEAKAEEAKAEEAKAEGATAEEKKVRDPKA
jgi:translation initiation factor 4G